MIYNVNIFLQDLDKDRLFIVTAKNNAMILEAQGTGPNLEIITKARGDVGDRIGQNAQTGTRYGDFTKKKVFAIFPLTNFFP